MSELNFERDNNLVVVMRYYGHAAMTVLFDKFRLRDPRKHYNPFLRPTTSSITAFWLSGTSNSSSVQIVLKESGITVMGILEQMMLKKSGGR